MNFSLTLLVTSILSLLQNICELFSIKFRNKSFRDWIFLLAQEQQMKLNTGEENDNSVSANLMEDIDPDESEIIEQSTIESRLNQDEEHIVVTVHSYENLLNEAAEMKAYDVCEQKKDTENQKTNSESPNFLESEIIQQSTIESRLNQDEEHIVVTVHLKENLLNEAAEIKADDVCNHKKDTENEEANSESPNFLEDIVPIESELIQQSINHNKFNQEKEHIVIGIHSNGNELAYQLKEAIEIDAGDIGNHGKETENENDNIESDNMMEDIILIKSELIQQSTNQSKWNQDDKHNVISIHRNENEETNQIDEAAEMKDGGVSI